jgi:hypothetical protein
VKQPEVKTRNRVVISRIAQIQKAKQLLIDEEKPQKTMILPGPAMKCKGKVRWITQGRENVPGGSDEQNNQQSAERP